MNEISGVGSAAPSGKRNSEYDDIRKTHSLPRQGYENDHGHIRKGYLGNCGSTESSNKKEIPLSRRGVSAEKPTIASRLNRQNSSSMGSVVEKTAFLDIFEPSQSSTSDDYIFKKRMWTKSGFSSTRRAREDKPILQKILLHQSERSVASGDESTNSTLSVGVRVTKNQSFIAPNLQDLNLPEWFDIRNIDLYGKPSNPMRELKKILGHRNSIENFKKLTNIIDSEQEKFFDFFDSLSNKFTLANEYLEKMNIPKCQIVLCGAQSSGKSSLMAGWTGIKTTICRGTGTKMAIIYQFSKDQQFKSEVNFEGDNKIEKFSTLSELNSHLSDIQKPIIGNISSKVLIVKVASPHCSRITIVDLPGDVETDSEQEKEIRNDMFKRFLNPHNILLRVMPEEDDKDGDGMFQRFIKSDTLSRNLIIISTKVTGGLKSAISGVSDKGDDGWLNGLFDKGFYQSSNVSIPVFGVDINGEVVSAIDNMSNSGKLLSEIWEKNDHQLYKDICSVFETTEKISESKRNNAMGYPACFGMEFSLRAVKWLAAEINKQNYENINLVIRTSLLRRISDEIKLSEKNFENECMQITKYTIQLDANVFYENFRNFPRFQALESKVRDLCNFRSGPFYLSKNKDERFYDSLSEFCKSEELEKSNESLSLDSADSADSADSGSDSIKVKELKRKNVKSSSVGESVVTVLAEEGRLQARALNSSVEDFIAVVIDAYENSASQSKSSFRDDYKLIQNEGRALEYLSEIVWEEMSASCEDLKKELVSMLKNYIYSRIDDTISKIYNLNEIQADYLKEYVSKDITKSINASYEKLVGTEPNLNPPNVGDEEIKLYGLFFSSLGINIHTSGVKLHLDRLKTILDENKKTALLGTKIAAATLAVGGTAAAVIASAGPLIGILGVGAAITSIFAPSLTSSVLSALSSGAKKIGKGTGLAIKRARQKDKVYQEKMRAEVVQQNNEGKQKLEGMKESLNILNFFAMAESIVDDRQSDFYDRITDQVFKQCIKDSVSIIIRGLNEIKSHETVNFDDNKHSLLFHARKLKETKKQLEELVGG